MILVCHATDTASLAAWFLFGKLFGVATFVGFGEKRCRKNRPLSSRDQTMNPVDQPYQADVFVTADQAGALRQLEELLRRDTTYLTLLRDMGGGSHALLIGSETEIDANTLFAASSAVGIPEDHWKFERLMNPPT